MTHVLLRLQVFDVNQFDIEHPWNTIDLDLGCNTVHRDAFSTL